MLPLVDLMAIEGGPLDEPDDELEDLDAIVEDVIDYQQDPTGGR